LRVATGIAIALVNLRCLQVQCPAPLTESKLAKGMLVPFRDKRRIEKG
jgi:hypothetical protein